MTAWCSTRQRQQNQGREDAMAGDGGELLALPTLLHFPNRRLLHDLDDGRYPF
jgi:hypothetical protein